MLPTVLAAGGLGAAQELGNKDEKKVVTAEEARKAFLTDLNTDVPSGSSSDVPSDGTLSPALSKPVRNTSSASKSSKSLTCPATTLGSGSGSSATSLSSIRVHTKGPSLSSGFPYHPQLFDLRVHPTKWDEFANQIVESTKLSTTERMKSWALGAGVAVAISTPDSFHIARNKSHRYHEDKVKAGVTDENEGSLGHVLHEWNEHYFAERGLLARLELSESAMKSPTQQSKIFRREAHWYPKKEDRERVREERKFAIVLTQLHDEAEAPNTVHELESNAAVYELPEDSDSKYQLAEMVGNQKVLPELHGGADVGNEIATLPDKKVHTIAELPSAAQYAELEGDNEQHLDQSTLKVNADTHEKVFKNLAHVHRHFLGL